MVKTASEAKRQWSAEILGEASGHLLQTDHLRGCLVSLWASRRQSVCVAEELARRATRRGSTPSAIPPMLPIRDTRLVGTAARRVPCHI